MKTLHHKAMIFYRAGHNMVEDYGMEMAGYLAFLQLLALFPYLVLMVSAAGLIGQGETGRQLIDTLLQNLPSDVVDALRPRIEEIISGPPHSLLTFSILGAIWTSSSAIEAVRGMLNRAYRVHQPPAYFKRRLTSIGQIILLTLMILVAMLLFVFTPIAIKSFAHFTGLALPIKLDHFFASYFDAIAALVAFAIVAVFYHVLPNIKQSWRAVVPGSLVVVALWGLAAASIGFYLNHITNVTLIYGSLSGLIGTLIAFYIMNAIFIYGAELNHELLVATGYRIVEKEVPAGQTVH